MSDCPSLSFVCWLAASVPTSSRASGEVHKSTELLYNLKDHEQRYLGPRLVPTKIVEAREDRREPGIFAIGKEATRER